MLNRVLQASFICLLPAGHTSSRTHTHIHARTRAQIRTFTALSGFGTPKWERRESKRRTQAQSEKPKNCKRTTGQLGTGGREWQGRRVEGGVMVEKKGKRTNKASWQIQERFVEGDLWQGCATIYDALAVQLPRALSHTLPHSLCLPLSLSGGTH